MSAVLETHVKKLNFMMSGARGKLVDSSINLLVKQIFISKVNKSGMTMDFLVRNVDQVDAFLIESVKEAYKHIRVPGRLYSEREKGVEGEVTMKQWNKIMELEKVRKWAKLKDKKIEMTKE